MLEERIAEWRAYLRRRQAIQAVDEAAQILAQLSERYPALAQLEFSGLAVDRILPGRERYKASLSCKA